MTLIDHCENVTQDTYHNKPCCSSKKPTHHSLTKIMGNNFPISESSNIITKIGLGDILIAGSDGQINAPGPAGQSERRE